MGTNIVRLLRREHRVIEELMDRMDGPRRRDVRDDVVVAITVHVEATESAVLDHLEADVDSRRAAGDHRQVLADLHQCADDLADAEGDARGEVMTRLRDAFGRHVELEESQFLRQLENSVEVSRLRRLGESFQRRKDTVNRSASRRTSHRRRSGESHTELYERARRLGIEGRSRMTRSQLTDALNAASADEA